MTTNRPPSWFDPAELGALAREVSLAKADARPTTRFGTHSAPASASPEGSASPARAIAPFAATAAQLDHRVSELLHWLRQREPALLGAFVTDAEGLPLASADASADYIAASASLMETLAQMRSNLHTDTGRIAVTVRPREILHLVAADTPGGALAVGLIAPEPLGDDVLADTRAALLETTRLLEPRP